MNEFPPALQQIKEKLYDPLGYSCNLIALEDPKYSGCLFHLNNHTVCFRLAKIIPKKTGQFVAIWTRDGNGKTAPFDIDDDMDYLMICTEDGSRCGMFIFPQAVCINQGMFSSKGKSGKRGIRVYPLWDQAKNKQAQKTQNWQLNYFLDFSNNQDEIFNKINQLFHGEKKKLSSIL